MRASSAAMSRYLSIMSARMSQRCSALHFVVDRRGEHLVAAADAEYRQVAGGPPGDGVGEAGLPQPAKVATM
jgi:hypothetical protein